MALTKRTYVDGETIITAQNLNDIQDEVIAHETNKVPITRTVNSKALSSNITLSASDVGAVPTTRTVNSKALSSNITLTAGDIGYNSSTTYSSSTVGKEISELSGAINDMDGGKKFFVGATQEYTTLRAGIAAAIQSPNSVVYVDAGTYDLVQEFGSDITDTSFYGIYLQNGIHVIFSSDAKVTYNYTGSDTSAQARVSPFNSRDGGFILENLTLECSRCRYCVHDERVAYTDRYRNVYLNCNMYIDNTNNTGTDWSTVRQCIGGGLGTNGEVIIKDCVFESKGDGGSALVSYHNTSASDGKSLIVVSGCYFRGYGTFKITPHGTSSKQTIALLHDNNFGYPPYITADDFAVESGNVKMMLWNNIIRDTKNRTITEVMSDSAVTATAIASWKATGNVVSLTLAITTTTTWAVGARLKMILPLEYIPTPALLATSVELNGLFANLYATSNQLWIQNNATSTRGTGTLNLSFTYISSVPLLNAPREYRS